MSNKKIWILLAIGWPVACWALASNTNDFWVGLILVPAFLFVVYVVAYLIGEFRGYLLHKRIERLKQKGIFFGERDVAGELILDETELKERLEQKMKVTRPEDLSDEARRMMMDRQTSKLLIDCPACSKAVSKQADICLNCGHPIDLDL